MEKHFFLLDTPAPGLEHPGQNKQQGPRPPGLEHLRTSCGQMPRTGASGTEQGAGAAAARTGTLQDKRCSERDKTRSNAKDKAEEKQGGREVNEDEETQGSKDEDGAVVQQRNRPMDEAGLMQRSSRED